MKKREFYAAVFEKGYTLHEEKRVLCSCFPEKVIPCTKKREFYVQLFSRKSYTLHEEKRVLCSCFREKVIPCTKKREFYAAVFEKDDVTDNTNGRIKEISVTEFFFYSNRI